MKSFRFTALIMFIFCTAILWQCGQPQAKQAGAYSDEIASRIRQVEENLLPAIIIKNEKESTQGDNILERMKHYKVPGVSVAVINNGKIEWAKGYGLTDKSGGKKVDTETLFQAASISKSVAAMGALKLAETGKIDLEGEANKYLKSWKIPANKFTEKKTITPAFLLNHSAGLTVHGFRGYAPGEDVPTLLQLLDGQPPANSKPILADIEPGSEWRYSGGGYCVMQQMMIDVAAKSFPQLMSELVLNPLDMKNSTYEQPLPEALRGNAAVGYRSNGDMVTGKYHTYPEMAAAGLWTTPSDLCRFAIEIQESLSGKSKKVLSQSMTQNMTTARLGKYGLGLAVGKKGNSTHFSHGGSNEGFRCMLFAYVESGMGAAVMSNTDSGNTLNTEILRAVAKVYGWPNFKPREKEIIEVDPAVFATLTGSYIIDDKYKFSVFTREDKLYLTDPDGRLQRLYPESKTKYFFVENGTLLDFVLDDKGKTVEIKIKVGGSTYVAIRKDVPAN